MVYGFLKILSVQDGVARLGRRSLKVFGAVYVHENSILLSSIELETLFVQPGLARFSSVLAALLGRMLRQVLGADILQHGTFGYLVLSS